MRDIKGGINVPAKIMKSREDIPMAVISHVGTGRL
jgi:hypothetical protein